MLVVTLDFENEVVLSRTAADGSVEKLGKVVLIRSGNSRIRIGIDCPKEVTINRQTEEGRANGASATLRDGRMHRNYRTQPREFTAE